MARTVFVMGAGASFEAGAPLMAGFLKRHRNDDGFPFNSDSESSSDALCESAGRGVW